MKREFTIDSCFTDEVPDNAAEIINFLNEEAERRGVNNYDYEDDTGAYIMDQIWENWCNGKIGLKKFAVIDQTTGDWFEDFFDTEEEALDRADYEWGIMSSHDKRRRNAYYVASVQMDSDGGYEVIDVIREYK